jgi:hypothetical protein
MVPVVMDIPWSQHTPLQGHGSTSQLGMEPTTLSMGPPGGTRASTLQEPYVDHLIGAAYRPQPLSKPPWHRGKEKTVTLSHYKTVGQSTVLPQETGLPGYGYYNPHASYRVAGHPSAPVGSFLATKGTPGGAYSSVSPAIGMPAPMVAPIRPPPMIQRKPLSYRTYKECSDPDAHIRYFEKCIWHNGETDEVVIINLLGTTLTDKVQRWYDDWLDYHQYCTWNEAKEAFKLRYREQDFDEQVYTALRTFKQGESEKV